MDQKQQQQPTGDQVDMKWNIGLGIRADIRVGSSKANSEDGAENLKTTEVLPKLDPVHPIKSTTPLSMRKFENINESYPRVFFMGWAFPYEQGLQKYRCESCFAKMLQGPIDTDMMNKFCVTGDITLNEFRARWQSFEDTGNICCCCDTQLCTLLKSENEILRFK